VSAPSDSPRALIRYTLVGLALTVGICWTLWEVSAALVLVYISALMAIGLSPLVNAIERKRLMRQQVPRWAAILVIYLAIIGAIIGVGILVIPAVVTQARDLTMELPRLMHQGQQWLINHGLLAREIMQRQVGISPVFVIIALLIGGSLLGVIGAILAVPTAAILQVLFQEIVTDATPE
jgi:predicted PurR-regulated permease PerM